MAQIAHSLHAAGSARQAVRRAAMHARPWIAAVARAGYAAKGVAYVLVGAFAFLAAFGRSAKPDTKSALASLLSAPLGHVLLAIVALGLAGFTLWCFVRAILDPEKDDSGIKSVGRRLFQFGKGLLHLALVVAVVNMVIGNGGGESSGQETKSWAARIMSYPLGIWAVGIVGASVAGYGLYQVYRGWKIDLDDQLRLEQMPAPAHRWAVRVGRFGIAARGVVFTVIGILSIAAALHANPQEAGGISDALSWLHAQPYGRWILALVAIGLVAYGLYEFLRARYRRIETS